MKKGYDNWLRKLSKTPFKQKLRKLLLKILEIEEVYVDARRLLLLFFLLYLPKLTYLLLLWFLVVFTVTIIYINNFN